MIEFKFDSEWNKNATDEERQVLLVGGSSGGEILIHIAPREEALAGNHRFRETVSLDRHKACLLIKAIQSILDVDSVYQNLGKIS